VEDLITLSSDYGDKIDEIIRCFGNDNEVEKQVGALEKAAQLSSFLAQEAVNAFEKSDKTRFLVAERLQRFGSLIVEPLENLFSRTTDPEVRTLSGLVLLKLKSSVGVEWLMKALSHDRQYACVIGRYLIDAGIDGVETVIVERLRNFRSDEVDLVLCFLDLLAALNYTLPADIRQLMSADSSPEKLRHFLAEFY
jgi:hypothetical protein